MNAHKLARALEYLYPDPKDHLRIGRVNTLDPLVDGEIETTTWPADLGAIPDQATLDAAWLAWKREQVRETLRAEADRRAYDGKGEWTARDYVRAVDDLLARYARKLRSAITRLTVLTSNTGDAQLVAIAADLDALEARYRRITDVRDAEKTIEPDVDAAADEAALDTLDADIPTRPEWPT